MKKLIAIPLFFFLFFFITNSYAYISPIYNHTSTMDFWNLGGVRCINVSSGDIKCYVLWDSGGSNTIISVFNDTNYVINSCIVCYGCSISAYGFAVINQTTAVQCTSGQQRYYNITSIESGSCSLLYYNTTGTGNCRNYYGQYGEYDGTNLYWGLTGISSPPPAITLSSSGYWSGYVDNQFTELSFPNKTNNADMWLKSGSATYNTFHHFQSDAYVETLPGIDEMFGLNETNTKYRTSIIRSGDGKDYIYIVEESPLVHGLKQIYKFNFTEAYAYFTNYTAPSNESAQPNFFITPLDAFASYLGGAFGVTCNENSMTSCRQISGIIFSIVFSIITIIVLAMFGGIKSDILGKILLISMLSWLSVFTLLSWLPTWLFAIFIIICGLIVSRELGFG